MTRTCSRLEAFEAWSREGADAELPESLAEHVETCEVCRAYLDEVQSIRELAGELPLHEISEERHRTIRFELMAAARQRHGGSRFGEESTRRRRLSRRALTGIALAAGLSTILMSVALIWVLRRAPAEPTLPIAQISLDEGAAGEDHALGPDRVYRLVRGAAEFDVRPLAPQERFRVLAGDGVVEVRGTSFRVEVRDGRLVDVRVRSGHVLVDVLDERVASLTAGERWTRETTDTQVAALREDSEELAVEPRGERIEPEETTPSTPEHHRSPVPVSATKSLDSRRPPDPRSSTPSIPESSVVPEPTDVDDLSPHEAVIEEPSPTPGIDLEPSRGPSDEAFAEAWALLRRGRPDRAARAFDALWARQDLDAAREADVLYWAAEAHRRSGNNGAAESRASMLLRQHPNAWRAPEARLILGEAALRRGESARGRMLLEQAAGSGRPSVVRRARRALEALDRPEPRPTAEP